MSTIVGEICSLMETHFNSNGLDSSDAKQAALKEVLEHCDSASDELTGGTIPSEYKAEVTLTGKKLAKWINPLDFSGNLNSAIVKLEHAEELVAAELALDTRKLEIKSLTTDHTSTEFTAVLSDISLQKDEIRLKLAHVLYLLSNFSLGAKFAYGVHFNKHQALSSLSDSEIQVGQLHQIRKGLIELRENYREIERSLKAKVIPISLRHSKYMGGPIVPNDNINTPNEQYSFVTPKGMFIKNEFELHLDSLKVLIDLNADPLWIRNIGIQVFLKDHASNPYPNMISATLTPMNSEKYFSDNKYKPDEIKFTSISTHTTEPNVTWANENLYIGVKPKGKWMLKLDGSLEKELDNEVLDVILYLDVVGNLGGALE